MVYVNSKKFACESCIKGHRSSSCHHNDRPLFEIKKKGRPVSQCEKCRELRQSKRVHSKCTCNESDTKDDSSKAAFGIKPKRFVPIVPALPNGLQDALQTSQLTGSLADARQRVDTLLNPCKCKSVWHCECRSSGQLTEQTESDKGLGAHVRAAAIAENSPSMSVTQIAPRKPSKRTSARPSSPSSSDNSAPNKRTKHVKAVSLAPGPDLAPIFLDTLSSSSEGPSRLPTFETLPPMSTVKSLAGSGCTCGFQCACPGCVEHRGREHTSPARKDCADGCGTCVDYTSGIALPIASSDTSSSSTSDILDRFFARAAALPVPPTNRKIGVGTALDPMDVTVYPEMVLNDSNRAVAFGLVTIPKLECCGGVCGCPEGTCGCGKACNGCCKDHQDHTSSPEVRQRSTQPQQVTVAVASDTAKSTPSTGSLHNCCGNKSISVAR